MKIVFYGGRQTGVIALLTLLALDCKVIVEKFLEVQGLSVGEVYNELYPLYSEVLIAALEKIKKRKR